MPSNNITQFSPKQENNNKKPKRGPIRLSWILSILLLVLIILAFGLSPLARAFNTNSSELEFGSYNGKPIVYGYGTYFYNQQQSISSNWDTDTTGTNSEYQIYQIWKQAYDNTVIHMAIEDEAAKSGIQVSEEAVDRYLLSYGPYINSDGNFDKDLYNSVSETTRKSIREDVSDSLLTQQVVDDLFGTYVVPGEVEMIDSLGKQVKTFDYALYPLSLYPDDKAVEYGEQNAEQFSSIEVSIITLSAEDIQESEGIYERLVNGEILFEEAARTYSVDNFAESGGDAGKNYYFAMKENFNSEEDLKAVFNLKEGEISELLETPYGLNIYRVDKTAVGADFSDAETIATIKNYLISYERGTVEDAVLAEAETVIDEAGDKPLADLAAELGLEVYSVAETPLNYGPSSLLNSFSYTDSEGYLSSIESDEQGLDALFSTPVDGYSDPITISSGFIIAYCTGESEREETLANLQMIYPYYLPQIKQTDFTDAIFNSESFNDNFLTIFFSEVLSTNS